MTALASHRAQVPGLVAAYFKRHHPGVTEHPLVTAEFTEARGWRSTRYYRKRVSGAWLRKLKSAGVTHVRLSAGGYHPEFGVGEILRGGRRESGVA